LCRDSVVGDLLKKWIEWSADVQIGGVHLNRIPINE
jgi:hypothetical protein